MIIVFRRLIPLCPSYHIIQGMSLKIPGAVVRSSIPETAPWQCYGTHLYRCTIGAKRLVNDCNGGNHTGAYSHIYMWVPLATYREPIRVTDP